MQAADSLYKILSIKSIEEPVQNFKVFYFDNTVNYKAGQYLTLIYHLHNEEIRRSYSITASPVLNESLSIGVKRIENGFFSRLLVDTSAVNDELITIGAGGLFILPDNIDVFKQVFFFAAGSGITPVYSLIKTLLYEHSYINVVLIYSSTSPDKTIFINELKTLEKKFDQRFHTEFLFSNNIDLSKARLHRDLLIQFLNRFSITGYNRCLFYICGPESYMRMCTYTLQENNVPKNNIKREDFVINAIHKRDALPPDKRSYKAYIKMNGKEYIVSLNYPDSILQSAKKQNIALPYSCEAGRCGSCLAICVKGKVWHSYNEVLTETDLKKGLILTCVGHAVNGDVELKIKES